MIQQEKFTEYELNQWPVTSSTTKAEFCHDQIDSRSEKTMTETEAKKSDDELVIGIDPEQAKQPELNLSEEQRLSNEQHLNRQV
ncbi:hypothetical protein FRC11_004887 [Ceratobasidium sp. 423]|nr:hypothetical protein FRC11_004887 [Ceratobasidium sp. 423]